LKFWNDIFGFVVGGKNFGQQIFIGVINHIVIYLTIMLLARPSIGEQIGVF